MLYGNYFNFLNMEQYIFQKKYVTLKWKQKHTCWYQHAYRVGLQAWGLQMLSPQLRVLRHNQKWLRHWGVLRMGIACCPLHGPSVASEYLLDQQKVMDTNWKWAQEVASFEVELLKMLEHLHNIWRAQFGPQVNPCGTTTPTHYGLSVNFSIHRWSVWFPADWRST